MSVQEANTETTAEALLAGNPLEQLHPSIREKLAEFEQRIGIAVLQLEEESLQLSETVDVVTVTDQLTYEDLTEKTRSALAFVDRATNFFEPWRDLFYKPYNGLMERKRSVLGVLEGSIKAAKNRLLQFEREERQRQEVEAAKRKKEQDEQEAERKLQLGIQAEQARLEPAAVEQILDRPSTMPTPTAAPLQRPAGSSSRKKWEAEVFNIEQLICAAADRIRTGDKSLVPFLMANQSKLNDQARINEATLSIPGVRAVNPGSLAIKR
jgi:hypothetical protein